VKLHRSENLPSPQPHPVLGTGSLWMSAAIALLALGTLYLFNPLQYSIYPPCLFHRWTGLACPGCGSLRALHHLSHGEIAAAFRFNPLLIAALIPGLWFVGRTLAQTRNGWSGGLLFPRGLKLWMLIVAVAIYGVVRNLSLWPQGWCPN
jgi:hypothetical protein